MTENWIGYEITDDPVENTRRWYDAVARAEYGDVITVVPGEYAVRLTTYSTPPEPVRVEATQDG